MALDFPCWYVREIVVSVQECRWTRYLMYSG
jgi:hypothetical protein